MIRGKKLVIIGAGGHGKVVADVAGKLCFYETILFLDDRGTVTECCGFPVAGKSGNAAEYIGEADIFVAIGRADARARVMAGLIKAGASLPVLIHPDAVVGQGAVIGRGTVVMAGAVINSDAQIGEGCIVNTCSSVDHDCILKDYVHVSVGAHVAGGVQIGDKTWIGAGAVVSNHVKIAPDCMVGAGAVVVKDILVAGTYVGVPARLIHS